MEDLDVPVGEEEKEVVKIMFEEEFNRTPYDAQIEVISQMVYSQKDHLLVRGTGGGKSGVPLGVLRMRGGVGVTVVPLLTIGSGQAVAAEAMCSDIDAHHWDEYSTLADKQRVVAELEEITSVDDTHVMLYISPQSLEGKDNILEKCLEGLFKKDLITVLAVDEMHRVPLDAPAFRTAFGKLQKKLVKKRSLSSRRVPLIGMTATLTKDLLEQFEKIMGVQFSARTWTETARRNITQKLVFSHLTLTPLMHVIETHRAESRKRKVAIFTNHASRLKNLHTGARKKLRRGEHAVEIEGKTGGLAKPYRLACFCEREGSNRFKHTNGVVLLGTSSASTGMDSPDVGAAAREGPPPHIVEWLQEMGRIRAQGDSNYPYEYTIAISCAMWAKLVGICKSA